MLLIDTSQILVSSIYTSKKITKSVTEDVIRHLFLNTIRAIRVKYKNVYGEPILCVDHRHHWRKDIFSYYKANRKKNRDKSGIDWEEVFKIFDIIQEEMIEIFPYKFIKVDGAEGDDIIATLCSSFPNEKKLILSADKDFRQLQKYPNVVQYDTKNSAWIKETDPARYLREHILTGDTSDGVPNFLSDNDSLSNPDKRQSPLTRNKIEYWLSQPEDMFYNELPENLQSNYNRNKIVIDFDRIPEELRLKILDEYHKEVKGKRRYLLNYFIKHKLRNLTPLLTEF